MSAFKLAEDFEITVKEAQDFIDAFYNSYPKLKPYFMRVADEALRKGYILVDKFTGRISHNDSLQRIYEESKSVIRAYNERNQQPPKKVLSDYYSSKGQIARNAQNYCIQGAAASMTKLAVILLMDVIRSQDLWTKVRLIGQVHDEIILEVDSEIAEWAGEILGNCMRNAGRMFISSVPVETSTEVSTVWEH